MMQQAWLKPASLSLAAIAATVVGAMSLAPAAPGYGPLPDFSHDDVATRKEAFLDYLRPIVRHHNERIREERRWLLRAAESAPLGWWDRRKLERLAEKYYVDTAALEEDEVLSMLRRRVDTVPESLVLVQAVKESGWGRSRFAREGNALFGQRCFEAGCGLVPGARSDGLSHEVRSFASVSQAVESYLKNLNTHERYLKLRQARQQLRDAGAPVTGTALASHLDDYSERREEYIAELKTIIRQNDLE